MGSLVGDAPGCPREIQGPAKGQLWGPWGDRQHARGRGTGRGPPEIQGPGEGWLQGSGGTGSMHRGDSWGPLEIWGPRGTCSTPRGMAAVPNGVPGEGRQWGPRETGSMPGGDPPQSRGPQGGTAMGRRWGKQGSWGGGQHGRARPEECGRPGSPGAAAAPCASRPGPRRRWWVWESCRCALGQPPAAAPRARRGPPQPRHGSHSSRISFFPF